MKTNRVIVIGSQVNSAELVTGLLISIAYRMCSSLAFSSEGEGVSDEGAQFEVTRSLGTLTVVVFMIYTQLTTSVWKTPHLCLGLVGVSLWAGNSILGYLSSKDARTESVNDIYWRAVQKKDRRLYVQ